MKGRSQTSFATSCNGPGLKALSAMELKLGQVFSALPCNHTCSHKPKQNVPMMFPRVSAEVSSMVHLFIHAKLWTQIAVYAGDICTLENHVSQAKNWISPIWSLCLIKRCCDLVVRHLLMMCKVPRSKIASIKWLENSLCSHSSKWVPDSLQSWGR